VTRGSLPGLARADHVALTVPDIDAAVRFYVDVLGAVELYRFGPVDAREVPGMPDGRDWTEAHIDVRDARLTFAVVQLAPTFTLELFGFERPPSQAAAPPRNSDLGGHHLALKVDDLDAALAFLRERGVRVLETIEVDEGPAAGQRAALFTDPWGNWLELVEYERLGYMDAPDAGS